MNFQIMKNKDEKIIENGNFSSARIDFNDT